MSDKLIYNQRNTSLLAEQKSAGVLPCETLKRLQAKTETNGYKVQKANFR